MRFPFERTSQYDSPIGPAPVDPSLAGLSVHPTLEARYAEVDRLSALGFNYFVGYIDTQGPYGLSAGYALWAGRDGHRADLHALIH